MHSNQHSLRTLALVLVSSLASAPALASQERFNGMWSVKLQTERGSCDSASTYVLAVQDGQVQYVSGSGSAPTSVEGRIGTDGRVGLGIRRSIAKADASGQLRSNSGSGTWTLPMLGCSGRWTAQRRTTTQARL